MDFFRPKKQSATTQAGAYAVYRSRPHTRAGFVRYGFLLTTVYNRLPYEPKFTKNLICYDWLHFQFETDMKLC